MGARDHFLRPRTPDRLRQSALPPLLCSVGLTPQDPPGTAFQPTPRLEGIPATVFEQMGWGLQAEHIMFLRSQATIWACPCVPGECPPHQGQCQTHARSSPPLSFCMNVRNSSFCLFIWPKIACRGYGYLEVLGGFLFVCLVFWVFFSFWFCFSFFGLIGVG